MRVKKKVIRDKLKYQYNTDEMDGCVAVILLIVKYDNNAFKKRALTVVVPSRVRINYRGTWIYIKKMLYHTLTHITEANVHPSLILIFITLYVRGA